MAAGLVGTPLGWILGVLVWYSSFAGILTYLSGFGRRALQDRSIPPGLGLRWLPMTQDQTMSPAAGEFPRQLSSGDPLSETAEDRDDFSL